MQLKDITITVTDPSGLVLFEISSEDLNKKRDKLPGDPAQDASPLEVAEFVLNEIKSLTQWKDPLIVLNKIEQKSAPRRLFAFEVFSSMNFDDLEDLEELANGEGVIESKEYGVLLLQTSELIRQFAAAEVMKRTGRA